MDHIEFDFHKVNVQIQKLDELIVRFQVIKEQYEECIGIVQNSWEDENSKLYYQKMLRQQEKIDHTLQKIRQAREKLEDSSDLAYTIEKKV